MSWNEDCPDTYEALVAAIDVELATHAAASATARAAITESSNARALVGYHLNYAAYCHGGVVAVRGMSAPHILAHAGFYLLPYDQAIARLANALGDGDDDCQITRLRTVCESDPLLEISGLTWLGERDLLKRGAINPFWLRRPLLGLGQPAKLHGLEPCHSAGHRGLYTLSSADLLLLFEAVANAPSETFGDLLRKVVGAGGPHLAKLGAKAIERDAAAVYEADCASFAAHQRAHGARGWRWKPPFSRQGHLAVTTARVREVDVPAERTRGHAANWLDDHGANPRFKKD